MVVLRSADTKDQACLRHVAVSFLGVGAEDWDRNESCIKDIFFNNGILGFSKDLIPIQEEKLMDLEADDGTRFSISVQSKLHATLALYHELSRQKGGPINILTIDQKKFEAYRIKTYTPNVPIVRWNQPRAGTTEDKQTENWQKMVKPSKSDFKEFKDEADWARWKEHAVDTLDAQGLSHLIEDPSYTPENLELDAKQQKWIYNVLTGTLKASSARAICLRHRDTKNVRLLWKELCQEMESSVTTELRTQKYMTYLTGTRLKDINWSGKQETFLNNWAETMRRHNEIAQQEIPDALAVSLLSTCLMGTPNLENVLPLYRTAQKAAGLSGKITFAEYMESLHQAAQARDGGNKYQRNPRSGQRTVNSHDLLFDDDGDDGADQNEAYQINNHDLDDPVEEFLYFEAQRGRPNGSNRRRAWMDANTWRSIERTDQAGWDSMSDAAKKKIMDYYMSRAAREGQETTTISSNNHNVSPTEETRSGEEPTTSLQASTHEIVVDRSVGFADDPPEEHDLLYYATHVSESDGRSSKQDVEKKIDFSVNKSLTKNKIKKKVSIQSSMARQEDVDDDKITYNVNAHRLKWFDDVQLASSSDEEDEEVERSAPSNVVSSITARELQTPRASDPRTIPGSDDSNRTIRRPPGQRVYRHRYTDQREIIPDDVEVFDEREYRNSIPTNPNTYRPDGKIEYMSGKFSRVPKPSPSTLERLEEINNREAMEGPIHNKKTDSRNQHQNTSSNVSMVTKNIPRDARTMTKNSPFFPDASSIAPRNDSSDSSGNSRAQEGTVRKLKLKDPPGSEERLGNPGKLTDRPVPSSNEHLRDELSAEEMMQTVRRVEHQRMNDSVLLSRVDYLTQSLIEAEETISHLSERLDAILAEREELTREAENNSEEWSLAYDEQHMKVNTLTEELRKMKAINTSLCLSLRDPMPEKPTVLDPEGSSQSLHNQTEDSKMPGGILNAVNEATDDETPNTENVPAAESSELNVPSKTGTDATTPPGGNDGFTPVASTKKNRSRKKKQAKAGETIKINVPKPFQGIAARFSSPQPNVSSNDSSPSSNAGSEKSFPALKKPPTPKKPPVEIPTESTPVTSIKGGEISRLSERTPGFVPEKEKSLVDTSRTGNQYAVLEDEDQQDFPKPDRT